MTDDIEMDAPQISTLPEEATPEPQPTPVRTAKFRVKLLVNEGKRAGPSTANTLRKPAPQIESEDEEEDEEDEEDQLIDDDDDDIKPTPTPPVTVSATPSARASPVKRGTGRGRGGGGGGRKRGGRGAVLAAAETSLRTASHAATLVDGWNAASSTGSPAATAPPAAKRRGGAAKGASGQRGGRKRAPKATKAAVSALLRDEAGSVSEAYAATAASSPLPHDEHSPEPDAIPTPSIPLPLPVVDDMNLEGVPIPLYPLPSKPFPVQPPPKIGSGFSPVIPLDKSGKSVRHWRQANKEIRGIAGGRWFTRSWIGDKESEYASAAAAASAQAVERENAVLSAVGLSVALPKLSAISISGGASGKGTPRAKAIKADAASGLATGASSRAASTAPESISAHISSKKRTAIPLTTSGVDTPVVSTPAA